MHVVYQGRSLNINNAYAIAVNRLTCLSALWIGIPCYLQWKTFWLVHSHVSLLLQLIHVVTRVLQLLMVNWVHPFFLKAKSAASKEDNPTWWEAMKGPFADEYWKAACKEIQTLEDMNAWDVFDRPDRKNVIESTWAFKLKRLPDGLVNKFKEHFCA